MLFRSCPVHLREVEKLAEECIEADSQLNEFVNLLRRPYVYPRQLQVVVSRGAKSLIFLWISESSWVNTRRGGLKYFKQGMLLFFFEKRETFCLQIAQPASTSFSVSTLWHSGVQRGMHIGSCENIAVQAGTNRNTLPQHEGSDGILAKENFEPPKKLYTHS